MALSEQEFERYKRHILLPEVGGQGQQKLARAKVLVVGAGGLGAPILYYLAAAGVGQIGICDDDHVSLSNLQRQILYTEDDLDKLKTTQAKRHLTALNPHTNITLHNVRVSSKNADQIVEDYDLVIEGVDNFAARYVLNVACLKRAKPLLSAGIGRFDGYVALFAPHLAEQAPCYQCYVPEEPQDAVDCETQGVLGAVPGVVGALAALEALKFITGFAEQQMPPQHNALLIFDGFSAETRRIKLKADPNCPACKE